MTREIRASIAMAVYNGEKYIDQQIKSIIHMMGENDELVISYEKSEDNSLNIIKRYAQTDNRIVIVYDKHHSVEENFNSAVLNCRGKYIFLSDQDDVWINDKINKMVAIFESDSSIKVVICDGLIVDENLRGKGSIFRELKTSTNGFRNFVKGSYLGCEMAFSHDILTKVWPVPITNPPMAHDLWLGIVASFYGKVVLVNEQLILHRLHGDNCSYTRKMSKKNIIKNRTILLTKIIKRLLYNKRNDVFEKV